MKLILSIFAAFCAVSLSVLADTWTISALDTHFMGTNSGLPGGAWPETSKFNSSINFTLKQAVRADASPYITQCGCNFTDLSSAPASPTGQPPFPLNVWQACDRGGIAWRVKDENGTTAANFTLEILVPEIDGVAMVTDKHTNLGLSYATVHVSSNDPSNPSSYLTCMGGAPLTGIHCGYSVNNIVLGLGGPIALNMSARVDTTTPPFNLVNVSYSENSTIVSSSGAQQCQDAGSSFNIFLNGSAPVHCSGSCKTPESPGECTNSFEFFWSDAAHSGTNWTSTLHVSKGYTQILPLTNLDGVPVEAPMRLSGFQDFTGPRNQTSVAGLYVVPVFNYDVVLGYSSS